MSNVSKISETHNSIVIMARVLEDNDSPIVERGFCWSIIANPDTSSNKVIVGNGIGEFSTTITDITPNTKYYIKAYAINTSGIKYSSEVSYSIDNATSYYPVIASIFNEVKTSFSLTMSATITEDKGSAVIERGFCWNKTGSPTMLENKISTGSGTGAFTSTIVGLEANTTYYVRAYATNAAGTSYYGNDGYTTHNANDYLPIIGTVSKTEETYGKLTVSSIISDDKGSHVTERGFCYSSPNSTPSITNGDKVVAGSGTGTFSSTLRNLSNTTYYIRAYAINAAGVSYSNSQTYSMREKDYYLPLVSSVNSNAPNSTTLTLTSSTSLVAYNSASVTERGFCWSATDSTPNINDNKVVASGSGVGSFSSTISNLSPTTTYCYRAYASNEWGIRYSNVVCGNYTNISSAFSYTCPYGFCVINSFVVVIDGYQGSPGKCWSTTNTLPTTNDNYETKSVVLDHGDRREYPFEINRIYDDTTYVRSCVRLEDGNMVYGKVISYTCGIYYHNTGGVFNNTVRIDGCRQVY
jgi:hypothetical protein